MHQFWLWMLFACVAPEDGGEQEPTPAIAPGIGDLLIEELYYSGASPEGGTDHYFSDQFVELVNASGHPLDLSGVMIGDAYGSAGEINAGMSPDSYAERRPEQVVLNTVWQIPDGVRLEPGDTMVIAHDGTNHRPFSTIDLSGAGFEAFVAGGNDDDHPTVRNLSEVVYNGGYDWLITVFGPSVVVLAPGTELDSVRRYATAPTTAVLDAVEALMDANSGAFKRLPPAVDTGFAYVSGTYVGESLHRKTDGDGWQDTNDSGADFEVGPPDPGRPPPSDAVYGDPFVELGTGQAAFEALEDGDSVSLVAGIQGGWHVDTTLRFGGFGPSGVNLVYEAFSADATRISFVTEAFLTSGSVLEEDDAWIRVGDRVVLDIEDPEEVVGTTAVLRVTAELDGQTWSDEREVVIE